MSDVSRPPRPAPPSERSHGAWRAWLRALACDPEAALSAALVYEGLPHEARVAWLDALEVDVPALALPKVAAYAPSSRSKTIRRCATDRPRHGADRKASGRGGRSWGAPRRRDRRAITQPLYLDFVELLIAHVVPDQGVESVEFESLVWSCRRRLVGGWRSRAAPRAGGRRRRALAHAVVATRRAGAPMPEGMDRFTELFTPRGSAGRADGSEPTARRARPLGALLVRATLYEPLAVALLSANGARLMVDPSLPGSPASSAPAKRWRELRSLSSESSRTSTRTARCSARASASSACGRRRCATRTRARSTSSGGPSARRCAERRPGANAAPRRGGRAERAAARFRRRYRQSQRSSWTWMRTNSGACFAT